MNATDQPSERRHHRPRPLTLLLAALLLLAVAAHELTSHPGAAAQPPGAATSTGETESDTLTYDFVACVDTTYGEPDPIYEYDVAEDSDSTGWQVTEPLDENKRFVWVVRAFDGYEYSDWTGAYQYAFFVNSIPEAPLPFKALYPPDTGGMPVFTMLPEFWWQRARDYDPFDTVHYRLEVSIDSLFNFVYDVDSVYGEYYTQPGAIDVLMTRTAVK